MRALHLALPAALLCFGAAAQAAEPAKLAVTLHNHAFVPAQLTAPANTPIEITITNADPTAEEFDSDALGVEKLVAGGHTALVRVRPLPAGRYPFAGEYHAKTAKGVLIVPATK